MAKIVGTIWLRIEYVLQICIHYILSIYRENNGVQLDSGGRMSSLVKKITNFQLHQAPTPKISKYFFEFSASYPKNSLY